MPSQLVCSQFLPVLPEEQVELLVEALHITILRTSWLTCGTSTYFTIQSWFIDITCGTFTGVIYYQRQSNKTNKTNSC